MTAVERTHDENIASSDNVVEVTKINIFNLNPEISEKEFIDIFGLIGPLAWTELKIENIRGKKVKRGCVAYTNKEDGEHAMAVFNGKAIKNFLIYLTSDENIQVPSSPVYKPPWYDSADPMEISLFESTFNRIIPLLNKEDIIFFMLNFMDEDKRIELINGTIKCHRPARFEHNYFLKMIERKFDDWLIANPAVGGLTSREQNLIEFPENKLMPDFCYFDKVKSKQIKRGTVRYPIPNLIVEVLSKSTEKCDKTIKKGDYEKGGVEELWFVDTYKESIEQYSLINGNYYLHRKILNEDGASISSTVCLGFEIWLSDLFTLPGEDNDDEEDGGATGSS